MKKYQMIQKILDSENLWAEVYPQDEETVIVEISWGDWKHEHLRMKWLLSGFEMLWSEVTEEDGSDCYSARYCYC